MAAFLAKRLGSMVGILLVLAAVVFMLQQVTPTDPVHVKLGANASEEQISAERHRLGYDDPIVTQYVNYVGDLLHGDLQESLRTRRPRTTRTPSPPSGWPRISASRSTSTCTSRRLIGRPVRWRRCVARARCGRAW